MQRALKGGYRPSTGTARRPRRNVGRTDRWISGAMGAASLLLIGRRHSTLGKALAATTGAMLLTRATTGHSRVYEALGVNSATLAEGAGIEVRASVTIKRPRQELYEFWRDLTNLPLVMSHLESVEMMPNGVTHWRAKGPRGMTVQWDAQPINEEPGEFVAWESMPGSQIENAGSVHFYDVGELGTEVLVRLRYVPPGMAPGYAIAKVLNPITEAEVAEDLRRFKHTMETGADISTQGQPMAAESGPAGT